MPLKLGQMLACNNKDAQSQRDMDDDAMKAVILANLKKKNRYLHTADAIKHGGKDMLEIAEAIKGLAETLQQMEFVGTEHGAQVNETIQQSLQRMGESSKAINDDSIQSCLRQASSSLKSANDNMVSMTATPKAGNLTEPSRSNWSNPTGTQRHHDSSLSAPTQKSSASSSTKLLQKDATETRRDRRSRSRSCSRRTSKRRSKSRSKSRSCSRHRNQNSSREMQRCGRSKSKCRSKSRSKSRSESRSKSRCRTHAPVQETQQQQGRQRQSQRRTRSKSPRGSKVRVTVGRSDDVNRERPIETTRMPTPVPIEDLVTMDKRRNAKEIWKVLRCKETGNGGMDLSPGIATESESSGWTSMESRAKLENTILGAMIEQPTLTKSSSSEGSGSPRRSISVRPVTSQSSPTVKTRHATPGRTRMSSRPTVGSQPMQKKSSTMTTSSVSKDSSSLGPMLRGGSFTAAHLSKDEKSGQVVSYASVKNHFETGVEVVVEDCNKTIDTQHSSISSIDESVGSRRSASNLRPRPSKLGSSSSSNSVGSSRHHRSIPPPAPSASSSSLSFEYIRPPRRTENPLSERRADGSLHDHTRALIALRSEQRQRSRSSMRPSQQQGAPSLSLSSMSSNFNGNSSSHSSSLSTSSRSRHSISSGSGSSSGYSDAGHVGGPIRGRKVHLIRD